MRRNPDVFNDAWGFGRDIGPLKRDEAFRSWFKGVQSRIEFYFKDVFPDKDDEFVIELLRNRGFEVNYEEGFVQRPDGKNRRMRIGGVLSRMASGGSQEAAEALRIFSDSSYRMTEGGLKIIVSRNEEDIATMSSGRSWGSCFTFERGGSCGVAADSLYEEVRCGGLVAYTVPQFDMDLNRATGRIAIRRLSDGLGHDLAASEKVVHGEVIPYFENDHEIKQEFQDALCEFLKTKNAVTGNGLYFLRGGRVSDSISGSANIVTLSNFLHDDVFDSYFHDLTTNMRNNAEMPYYSVVLKNDFSSTGMRFYRDLFFGESPGVSDYDPEEGHSTGYRFGVFPNVLSASLCLDKMWENLTVIDCEFSDLVTRRFSSWSEIFKIVPYDDLSILYFNSLIEEIHNTMYVDAFWPSPRLCDENFLSLICDVSLSMKGKVSEDVTFLCDELYNAVVRFCGVYGLSAPKRQR